jgi:hypothetical protein
MGYRVFKEIADFNAAFTILLDENNLAVWVLFLVVRRAVSIKLPSAVRVVLLRKKSWFIMDHFVINGIGKALAMTLLFP